jgi:hypothetical protein
MPIYYKLILITAYLSKKVKQSLLLYAMAFKVMAFKDTKLAALA